MFRSSSCLRQETLSTQLQRGKVDAYLLTQGIEQAGKVSYLLAGIQVIQQV